MLAVERGTLEIVQKLIDLDASMAYKNKVAVVLVQIAFLTISKSEGLKTLLFVGRIQMGHLAMGRANFQGVHDMRNLGSTQGKWAP